MVHENIHWSRPRKYGPGSRSCRVCSNHHGLLKLNIIMVIKTKRTRRPSSSDAENIKKRKRVSFSKIVKSTSDNPAKDEELEDNGHLIPKPKKGILKKKMLANASGCLKIKEKGSNSLEAIDFDNKEENELNNIKGKRTMSLRKVKHSTKEMLMKMTKKERREFIRELERRNKPNFELMRNAKLLWETIRSTKVSEEKRSQCVSELMQMCQGKFSALAFSHATSRVVQCLLKLRKPEIRNQIFEELKTQIVQLAMSKFGKYFILKLFKYGTKEQRDHLISSLKGNYVRLYKSLYSASLVNEIYIEWGNAKQYRQLVNEFYGPEFAIFQDDPENKFPPSIDEIATQKPEKLAGILQNLEKLLDSAVLKVPILKLAITHKLLYDFLRHCSNEQRDSLIESLKDFLPEICHTHEGSYAALLCVWNSNPEQRISIVKSFTGLAISACKDNFVQRVLFGIFDCVDDTNLVNKIIVKEIANNIADLIYDKHGVIVLHYLVHPRDPHVIAKSLQNILKLVFFIFKEYDFYIILKGDSNPHSKLDFASRYLNLFECVKPALLTFMKANMREMITNKISAVLILDTLDVNSPSSPFQRSIDQNDLSDCFKEIAQISTDEFIPHCVDKERPLHIIAGGCARFVFRKLLKNDRLREKVEEKLSFYLMSIVKKENLQSWTGMDCGCYTLIELMFHKILSFLQNSSLQGAKKLLVELNKIEDENDVDDLSSSNIDEIEEVSELNGKRKNYVSFDQNTKKRRKIKLED
uniref:PUM-HD domain-containing protein n=1 Tax=Meloidogyne hapla TaxID=6305 RepID=A0A1I8BT92_MELHA